MSQRQRTREDDIDDAMARLNRRRGDLCCLTPQHPYGGNIQRDLELVLDELHSLRAAALAPQPEKAE